MGNRVIDLIEEINREAEHHRRCQRILRSQELYCAALTEANDAKITLVCERDVYRMWDAKHHIAFYPAVQVVMRSIMGKQRLERIDLTAECDVLDVTLLFLAGEFLK